jgi:hypothetical protein
MARDELAPLALIVRITAPRVARAAAGSFPTAPPFVEETETS